MTGRRTPLLVLSALLTLLLGGAWFVLLPAWSAGRLERARSELAELLGASSPAEPRPDAGSPRWLEDGLDALHLSAAEGERLAPLVGRPPAEWSRSDREMVTTLARREAEALARIERGGSLETLGKAPRDGGAPSVDREPDAATTLRAGRLLLARAGLALRTGPGEAGRSLVALAEIARALERSGDADRQDLATAVEELFLRGVRWMVESPEATGPVLDDLYRALPTVPGERRILELARALASPPDAPEPDADGLLDRIAPWRPALRRARALDGLIRLVRSRREPGRMLAEARKTEAVAERLGAPGTVDRMLRIQAVESARVLARLALELRLGPREQRRGDALGRRLAAVPSDPLSGGRPRATPWTDGSLMIENPDAEEAWRSRWGDPGTASEPPPYAWLLPPA